RNVLPSFPPTLIQFSGATSKKSIGASGVSCSGPKRARRRPSPAPVTGWPGRFITSMTRAGTFLALLVRRAGAFLAFLVGRAGTSLALLVGAAGRFRAALVRLVAGGEFVGGQHAVVVGVHRLELVFVPAGGLGFFHCDLAVLVRIHLGGGALAFAALAFG